MHFVIFHPYDTPTFKTNALCLVSNEGQVRRLLLLYLAVTGDAFCYCNDFLVRGRFYVLPVHMHRDNRNYIDNRNNACAYPLHYVSYNLLHTLHSFQLINTILELLNENNSISTYSTVAIIVSSTLSFPLTQKKNQFIQH